MKKFFVLMMFVMLALTSCHQEGQTTSTNENYGGYNVQKLFTIKEDSTTITVYRFMDFGNAIYFTNKSAFWRVPNGKSSYPTIVE